MRNKCRIQPLSLFCLVLLLAGAAGGCGPTGTPAPPTPVSTPVEPTPPRPTLGLLKEQPFFVPDLVIVIGPRDMVIKILGNLQADVDALAKEHVDLGLHQPVRGGARELGYVDALIDTCPGLPQYKKTDLRQFVMHLYQLPSETLGEMVPALRRVDSRIPPETPVAAAVAAAINARGNDSQVYADLVYRTGRLAGYPFEPAPSPFEPAPSPYDEDPIPGVPAVEAFWTQWAFHGEHGIDLIEDKVTMDHGRTVDNTGAGVRIGIFDTSPYTTAGMKMVDWLTPQLAPSGQTEMVLEVMSPYSYSSWPRPALPPISTGGQPVLAPAVDDHGLFVAGLAYAVAPRSQIQLYPVLDKYRQGDLFALDVALDSFIKAVLEGKNGDALDGAVINLSLGLHTIPQMLDAGVLMKEHLTEYGLTRDLLAPTSTSLETLLAAASCSGIVVAAAAGNNSRAADVKPADAPAVFTDVLAVAGSNHAGTRSCFSNEGEVMAPAGDGDWECNPAPSDCPTDCAKYRLIGPVRPTISNTSGLAYWAGTSFATPLVSGMAALVIEASGGWGDSKQVIGQISTTNGIVNVPQTVSGISPQQ